MNNFAGRIFRTTMKATAFNYLPKYSNSYLQTTVHQSTMQWINMETLSVLTRCNLLPTGINILNVQNLTEVLQKCKEENTLDLDITKGNYYQTNFQTTKP